MTKENKYEFTIEKDIQKDAQNWWQACNKISHGTDWGSRIDATLLNNIKGKTEEDAYKFLIPFLEKKYQEENADINKFIEETTDDFNKYFIDACQKMAAVTEKPLYRKSFTIFITTFPRGPYDKRNGSMLIYINWGQPLKSFLHELCHFQFIHYWGENNNESVMKLSQDEFEYLKESLTIVIDESFFPMINGVDKGYAMHQDFRKTLRKQWEKDKNFDNLILYGIQELPNYIKSQ